MTRRGCPSLYEIKCENGEIEEDDGWRYEPVDCGDYYMIEQYKYANSFPKEWAMSHLPGTGPEQCGNCYDYGSKDNTFIGYCLNCADYDYNGERGPGMDAENELCGVEDEQPCVETESQRRFDELRECSEDPDLVFKIVGGNESSDEKFFGLGEN
jgi:hypothetical protein